MSPRREPRKIWTTDESVERQRLAKRLDELQAELADLVRAIDQRVTASCRLFDETLQCAM
jgi:hypothetical protein